MNDKQYGYPFAKLERPATDEVDRLIRLASERYDDVYPMEPDAGQWLAREVIALREELQRYSRDSGGLVIHLRFAKSERDQLRATLARVEALLPGLRQFPTTGTVRCAVADELEAALRGQS